MSARIVRIRSRFRAVKEDPDDDTILRTAYDGRASYISSGDMHLLDMKKFRRVRMVAVEEMLEILKGY